MSGKKAYMIEAVPKTRSMGSIECAKIWVDKTSFQILKSEIEGVPTEGYKNILKEAIILNVKPSFKTTHIYEFKRKGVLFPGHSEVRVAYPELRTWKRMLPRLKIDMTYKCYQEKEDQSKVKVTLMQ